MDAASKHAVQISSFQFSGFMVQSNEIKCVALSKMWNNNINKQFNSDSTRRSNLKTIWELKSSRK